MTAADGARATATVIFNSRDCPEVANHTPEPDGYSEWFDWAHEMAKSYTQTRCPACLLLVIWRPRKMDAKPVPFPASYCLNAGAPELAQPPRRRGRPMRKAAAGSEGRHA